MVPFQLPCGKCTECHLERARDWSIRCVHESKMYAQNSFITLTYDDQHLPPGNTLKYLDFQLFMKRLRKHCNKEIGFFMCGEYGETTGRAHYHACIFGYDFEDKLLSRENKHGDQCWTSDTLNKLWSQGLTEIGSVTQKSAGYVARYILKKQAPGTPKGFQKMSTKHAIGKAWIEKYYKDVFIAAQGSIILSDGSKTKVPRYYEKWFKQHHPQLWSTYVTQVKLLNTERLTEKATKEHEVYLYEKFNRGLNAYSYKSPLQRKRDVLHNKAKQLLRKFL